MENSTKYPVIDISQLAEHLLAHKSNEEITLIVRQEGFDYPIRFRRSLASNYLIAHYNGAVDRKRAPDGIVFQRSSWREELDSNVIYFSDPTLLGHPNLTIGWGQLSADKWAIPGYIQILKILRRSLDMAPPWRTIHYSSSAGGFQAIATATLDRGSYAVANNPQIDICQYNPTLQRRMFDSVFNGHSTEEILLEAPWRFNLVKLFEKEERIPRIKLAINALSPTDYRNQLMHFLEQIDKLNFTPKSHVRVDIYYDEKQGHKPLSRVSTKRLLKEELARISAINTPHNKLPIF